MSVPKYKKKVSVLPVYSVSDQHYFLIALVSKNWDKIQLHIYIGFAIINVFDADTKISVYGIKISLLFIQKSLCPHQVSFLAGGD